MFKKFLPLFLVASLFLCASVPAQNTDTNLQVSTMEIDIWPEYDQPSTLVIYRISFASLTNFPAKVSFRIPTSAGDPYSVAMKDLDGLLYDLEYSVIPDGNWSRIEFITSSPDIQLEFYDPIKQNTDGAHSYSYQGISDYPIEDLKIIIQQPRYAASINLFPDLGPGKINSTDGLMYYTSDVGTVAVNTTINLALSYQKTNSKLSAGSLTVSAVNPVSENNSGWNHFVRLMAAVWENQTLISSGLLILAGILLLLAAILLSTHKRNLTLLSDEGNRETRQKKRTVNSSEIIEVYCHVCGKRARPGDLYCRVCGSKLIQR
jgi:hypothetical protein